MNINLNEDQVELLEFIIERHRSGMLTELADADTHPLDADDINTTLVDIAELTAIIKDSQHG